MSKSQVKRNYCDNCKFCINYGKTDELYCTNKETFVEEIDCCDDWERKENKQ